MNLRQLIKVPAILVIMLGMIILSSCAKTTVYHQRSEPNRAPQSAYGKPNPSAHKPKDVTIGLPSVTLGSPMGEIKSVPIRSGGATYISTANMSAQLLTESEALKLARTLSPKNMGISSWSVLRPALQNSLTFAQGRSQGTLALNFTGSPGLTATWGEMTNSLKRMMSLLPQLEKNTDILATQFRWYKISKPFGFTGYYEPTLQADTKQSAAYPYPIYRRPPDLVSGKAYHDRRAIDQNKALAGRGLELAWVKDDVGLFFLHVQGSGRLVYPNGSVKHILYADKNNRRYASLGGVLRDKGYLAEDNISMQSIKEVLAAHPKEKNELMYTNPSYVFFRLEDQGPVGGMGYPLTANVSIAVDRKVLPYGSMVFFSTTLPNSTGQHVVNHNNIGLAQDTGGAINGRRIDLFRGAGEKAESTAGFLNSEGAVYILLPNTGK